MTDALCRELDSQLRVWGACKFSSALPLLETRSKSRLPKNPAGIIVLLFAYYSGEYSSRNIARYSLGEDYHTLLKCELDMISANLAAIYPRELFIPFVDASPIAEVRAACLAGLGEIGINGQLISPLYGSDCFIGEIVTTLDFSELKVPKYTASLCMKCGHCIAACPSGALSEKGFQKEKCRSFFTQKKSDLSAWEYEQIRQGALAWGCDRCTDSCPVNIRIRAKGNIANVGDITDTITMDNISDLCKNKAYGWRGEAILRRNLGIING